MKKIFGFILIAAVVGLMGTACKTQQKVVKITGADISAVDAKATSSYSTVSGQTNSERTIDERFRLADGETNNTAFNKKYHVVVGSFSVQKNAKNLQNTLKKEGNNALVVINEQGMFRVLIASFDEYAQARTRINQIKNRFPDAWVLRQK